MPISQPKTAAFYEGVKGWPSFYTFIPDGIVSLNNRLFSFRDGNIWEHNIDPSIVPVNTFYGDTFTLDNNDVSESKPSYIEFIFNEAPDSVKNFKTISYEGEGVWEASISTDQESIRTADTSPEQWTVAGTIADSDFVNKEGKLHAWIRGVNGNIDLKNTTVGGIGNSTVNSTDKTLTLTSRISASVTVGDDLYYYENTGDSDNPVYGTEPQFLGNITSINSGKTVITYSNTTRADGSSITTAGTDPSDIDFIIYAKDRITETSGLIGFFAIVRMTNTDNTVEAELFAVETEAFQSSN